MTSDIYDATFGGDPMRRLRRANLLLKMVGLTVGRVGDVCDAWVERTVPGALRIVIYTRNGSGTIKVDHPDYDFPVGRNRIEHTDAIRLMQASPFYLGDADDTFDPLYAAFYFQLPTGIPADVLEHLEREALAPVDTDARWREAVAKLKGES